MNGPSSEESSPQDVSPLIDLSRVSLDDLAVLDDSVLVHSLKRVLGDAKNPDEVVLASFSAII